MHSFEAQIGISAAATASAASAFAYILETPMFNTSDPKSLTTATNVTSTLALASANKI